VLKFSANVFNVAVNFEFHTVVIKDLYVTRLHIPFSWHVRMLWSIVFYKGGSANDYKVKIVTIE